MEIETKNASLDTFAVTIQALHVSGKQMTLAVFRQLPVTNLMDQSYNKDQSLKWWGLVRYRIADEGEKWVVCEKDGKLYRATFSVDSDKRFKREIEKIKAIRPYLGADGKIVSRPDLAEKLAELFRSVINVSKNNEVANEAEALPQLFIAV
jgi:hypothetical protein